jgi:anthranilate phosphoribosyltransferase
LAGRPCRQFLANDLLNPFMAVGGDTLKTFNVSTAAAIVAAACGLYVVRHSSRATSSNCGAIDVLQALGINVESGPELPKQSIERVGICAWNAFLPWLHPRFLVRMPARIRFDTTINFVGPLLSPTMPSHKVMGVKSPESVDFESRLLGELGFKRAFVMHGLNAAGEGGMDEFSTLGPSHVAELRPDGSIEKSVITPEELGLRVARYEDIASSRDVHREALTLLRVIAGKDAGANGKATYFSYLGRVMTTAQRKCCRIWRSLSMTRYLAAWRPELENTRMESATAPPATSPSNRAAGCRCTDQADRAGRADRIASRRRNLTSPRQILRRPTADG